MPTATRSQLIRKAASLPKGSSERRSLLRQLRLAAGAIRFGVADADLYRGEVVLYTYVIARYEDRGKAQVLTSDPSPDEILAAAKRHLPNLRKVTEKFGAVPIENTIQVKWAILGGPQSPGKTSMHVWIRLVPPGDPRDFLKAVETVF